MNQIGMYEIGKQRMEEMRAQADAWRLADEAQSSDKKSSSFIWLFIGSGFIVILLGLAVILGI